MRGGFGGFSGRFGQAQASAGGTPTAPPGASIPASMGGNAVQGKGIVFTYQTPNVALLNHGTGSGAQPIQFDNNSTFLWLRSTFTYDVAEAQFEVSTQPVPLITVQIQDTGNGMQFMNAPVPVYEIAGIQSGLPYILPTPQLIQPNASYTWTFANYDAAVNYANIRFQLHGFRLFSTNISDIRTMFQAMQGG